MVGKYHRPLFRALADRIIRKDQKLLPVVRGHDSGGAGMGACPSLVLALFCLSDVDHTPIRFLCYGIHTLHDLPVTVRS